MPNTDTIQVTPSLAQFDFIANLDAQCVAIIGAKGSGKTWAGARFVAHMVSLFPGSQGLLMWNTLQQARDIYVQDIKPMFEELGWPHTMNTQTMTMHVGGCVVHFRSAEPDVVRRIESVQYHWGWADEASYYPADSLRTFASRIRKGKALIRISSMPDDPDAFIYKFLDDLAKSYADAGWGFRLYEIGLSDNPDADMRARYEVQLRSIYDGDALRRYLDGERVSLEGQGAFRVSASMLTDVPIDPDKDILLSWDFNNEYRAVTGWQEVGRNLKGQKVVACVKSWQMKEATVMDDAQSLCAELAHMKASIVLDGDASGDAKTPMATVTAWGAIRQTFQKHFPGRVRYVVASANPSVQSTIECLNWALREGLVMFDHKAKACYTSLASARLDKSGGIDKTKDNMADKPRSHETDTARYAGWHFFKRDFPGNVNRYFVV